MDQLDPLNSTQPLRVFRTKVVGVSYHNKDGTHRQDVITKCRIGEKLLLVPEPTNLHDADAVKVMRLNGEQIGYLSRSVALEIGQRIVKHHSRVDATVFDILGGERFGVTIEITKYKIINRKRTK